MTIMLALKISQNTSDIIVSFFVPAEGFEPPWELLPLALEASAATKFRHAGHHSHFLIQ